MVKQNLPFWSEKSFRNTFSGLGNLLHSPRQEHNKCFLPPAELIGISWNFGSFSFLVKSKITQVGNVWVEIPFILQEQSVSYMIPLANTALQESR